jgi:hypothetical protein
MRRVTSWDVRLVQFAREVVGASFVWGDTDCATLMRRAQSVLLGSDPFKGRVGNWTTKRGALRVVKNLDVLKALRTSGGVEVGERYATAGDVMLGAGVDARGLAQLATVLPVGKVLASTPETGVVIVRRKDLEPGARFWRYVNE